MAWDQTTLQNVHPPVLVGRRFLLLCHDKKMAELKECTEILVKIRSCSKNVLYLSVKVIGTQLLLEKTFFTCSDRDDPPPPTPVFEWPFEPHESLLCLQSKDCAFFLRYLKTTMSIGPLPGIKPATFRPVKKIGVLS